MSKSIYARYYEERENINTLEKEYGFATYKFGPDYVYIIDIYILPQLRKQGLAASLADEIVEEARLSGKTKAFGSVDQEAKGKREAMLALLGYGMEPSHNEGTMIYFKKDINEEPIHG